MTTSLSPDQSIRQSGGPFTSRQLKQMISQQESSMYAAHPMEAEADQLNPNEEMKEVSNQLAIIRKQHDVQKEANKRKKDEMAALLQELETMNTQSVATEESKGNLKHQIQDVNDQIEMVKSRHQQGLHDRKMYQHMMDRMKDNKIHLEINSNHLNRSLRGIQTKLAEEQIIRRKSNEEKFQSKLLLEQLQKNINIENAKKQERIQQLEKQCSHRQEIVARREERNRRQAEIAEAAANEDKYASEIKAREVYSVHKFWFGYLKKRLISEQTRSADVEETFQNIKSSTGIGDVQEVVDFYLNKEGNYASLLTEVSKAEEKLDALTEKHAAIRLNLRETTILKPEKEDNSELDDLKEGMHKVGSQYHTVRDKLQNTVVVYDKVVEWGLRVLSRLLPTDEEHNLDLSKGSDIKDTKNSVEDLFAAIFKQINERISELSEQKDTAVEAIEQMDHRNTNEVLDELYGTDFWKKNVRRAPDEEEEVIDEQSGSMADLGPTSSEMELKTQRESMKKTARDQVEKHRAKQKKEEPKNPGDAR